MKKIKLLLVLVFALSLVACGSLNTKNTKNTVNSMKNMKETNKTMPTSTVTAAKSYAKFWNTGDEKYAYKALSQDFKDLNLPDGRPQGIEGVLFASKTFRTAVPNLKAEIKEYVEKGNKIIVRYQFTGNFTGTFGNHIGNNQKIDFQAVDIYTIKNNKIVKNWHLEDNLTLLSKMGVAEIK